MKPSKMDGGVIGSWRWRLSSLLFIIAPFLFIGYVISLRSQVDLLWLDKWSGMGVIMPFLAGTLGIIVLSSILKVTQAHWIALLTLLLALGVLVSLGGGLVLNWSQKIGFLVLILATVLACLGVGVSGTLRREGAIIVLLVAVLSSVVLLLSLFSSLLSILLIYLWPFLGIGLFFRQQKVDGRHS